jgi:hypothetical protein
VVFLDNLPMHAGAALPKRMLFLRGGDVDAGHRARWG